MKLLRGILRFNRGTDYEQYLKFSNLITSFRKKILCRRYTASYHSLQKHDRSIFVLSNNEVCHTYPYPYIAFHPIEKSPFRPLIDNKYYCNHTHSQKVKQLYVRIWSTYWWSAVCSFRPDPVESIPDRT